jgi:alpha-L-fucosidase 2
VGIGSTLDHSLIRAILGDLLEAESVLGTEDPLVARAADALVRIPRMTVGAGGRVVEWAADLPEAEPGHRHFSPLFGLYPGNEVGDEDRTLRDACRATLVRRLDHGGGHTGWSCAWLVNLWARLGDGEAAGAAVRKLLTQSTLPNLLDDHPPFQIDGNFGGLAGILEMLCQSHGDRIRLLPALPAAWSEGGIRGIRTRGGFTLDFAWTGGVLVSLTVRATRAGDCRLTWPGGRAQATLEPGESWVPHLQGVSL